MSTSDENIQNLEEEEQEEEGHQDDGAVATVSGENNTRKIQCSECGMTFGHQHNLRVHSAVHKQGKSCEIECYEPDCSATFSSNELLRKHLRITHGNLRLKCSHCEKVYGSSSALRRHERIHSDSRRYVCDVCGTGFDLSEPYKIHLRTHRQIRPYECSVCRKSFASRAVCRRHRKQQHTDEAA